MFGLPRDVSHMTKLGILLSHIGVDPGRVGSDTLQDAVNALLDYQTERMRRGLPTRTIAGELDLDRDLRDCAFVLAAQIDPARVARLVTDATLDQYLHATADWLQRPLQRHGYRWPQLSEQAA